MPCISIALLGTSPDLLSVIYLTLATYWKQNLNVFCPMPPNVIHTQCQNCAYIFHIQFTCLLMVESAIRVRAFFQGVVHAHISFPLKVAPIFWQISHCLVSCNQYFCKIRCGIFWQEPCHKFDEHWMAVFWVFCLSYLPLCI